VTEGGIVQQIFEAKWICNGFPKSGTHLLVQMVQPVAPYNPGTESGLFDKPWTGTFQGNSWTEEWAPLERTFFKAGRIRDGHMLKAHLGYNEDLERFLYLLGAVHIFIYRDLRDVAVSQAHHIIDSDAVHIFIYRDLRDVAVSQAHHIIDSDEKRFAHPDPDVYPRDDFDEVLAQVIAGIERFPGVVERWRYYAPWLDVDWVLSVRFRDLRDEPKVWAERIFTHAVHRNADNWGREIEFDPDGLRAVVNVMAKASRLREKSPTFREGKVGGWQEAFTERHRELFKASDTEGWLVKLGFEKKEDW